MRYDTWLTLSGSEMDFKAITASDTPGATFGGKLSHPTSFSSYRDPEGRFLLRFPDGWPLREGPPVEVRSNRLPLAARVDVVPPADPPWEAVQAVFTRAGGLLIAEKHLPGPPRELRARLVTRDGLLSVCALAHPIDGALVVLSTALAPAPTPDLERYGRAVLAAVRREFRVPAPQPPG